MVPIIGNWVVPFEEIRWYPFRKLAGSLSGNSALNYNKLKRLCKNPKFRGQLFDSFTTDDIDGAFEDMYLNQQLKN
jgi:hypothetical protein